MDLSPFRPDYAQIVPGLAARSARDMQIGGLDPDCLLATRQGPVAVRHLRPGDRILTCDNGYRPLLRREEVEMPQPDRIAVILAPGAFGPGIPDAPLCLFEDHGLLLRDPRLAAQLGTSEVLVHAGQAPGATPVRSGFRAVKLVFEVHDFVLANGLWVDTGPLRPPMARALRPRMVAARLAALPQTRGDAA